MHDSRRDQNVLFGRQTSGKVRSLTADGHHWLVREVPAPLFDRRGGTHLLFDAEIVMRRVRVYPANWETLSDDELYALADEIRRGE